MPAFMAEHPEDIGSDRLYQRMRETDMYVPRAYVREEWGRRRKEKTFDRGLTNGMGTAYPTILINDGAYFNRTNMISKHTGPYAYLVI